MNFKLWQSLGGTVVALSLGLTSIGIAHAQQPQPGGGTGLLMGEVDRCVNGTETPTAGVSVGVVGGSLQLARSDGTGAFVLALTPGEYTIQATADDGATGTRPYVPVEANATLDIGVLELAGGCGDTGLPAPAPAAAQPTVAPTATAVPATPVPTPIPPTATAVPPTPVPAPDEQAPATDEPAPDATSDAG
ncbi:MAG TPA: carboxypeptidase-like regulatory domain-containing protein [Chloroflexota bacterium]|jgi:hypothetical protein